MRGGSATDRGPTRPWVLALLFVLAVFLGGMPFQALNWNLIGDASLYGVVEVPGTATLQLPAGPVEVAFAELLPGRGNQTPDVVYPKDLALTIAPSKPDLGAPTIVKELGGSSNTSAAHVNAELPMYHVTVARAGAYVVTAKGSTDKLINTRFLFGKAPLPAWMSWAASAVLVSIAFALTRRRGGAPKRETAG